MLLSKLYMPNAPEDCHNNFKSCELHSALERLFPKKLFKLEENTWKNSFKEQTNTILRFPFHFISHLIQ